jgi:hypothetical protein
MLNGSVRARQQLRAPDASDGASIRPLGSDERAGGENLEQILPRVEITVFS